jgi:hypothetical protein
LCDYLSVYGQALKSDEGNACSIKCPWSSEHTGASRDWSATDSSTALFWEPGQYPGFRCLHTHCEKRTIKDFLAWCEEQEPGVVDRHCNRQFRPQVAAADPQDESPDYIRNLWPALAAKPNEFEQAIHYPLKFGSARVYGVRTQANRR